MSPVNVIAATLADGNILPVMDTEIRLYNGSTEITNAAGGTFLSQTLDTTCMTNFISTTKAFHVYCTDQTKFQFPGGTKDFTLTYKLQYVQVESTPANASTNAVVETFTLKIRNKCWGDVLTKISSTTDKKTYAGATMKIPAI